MPSITLECSVEGCLATELKSDLLFFRRFKVEKLFPFSFLHIKLFIIKMVETKTAKPTETKKVAEPVVLDVSDSNVQTKYKDAGKIADGN
jgi:hypothetical protein